MKAKAIRAIEKNGALLVFPIDNRKEPRSIWSELYPRSEMRWEWDDDGDNRVASLWHLREELSRSRKVVYSKWYQGRATCFSLEVFTALLAMSQSLKLPGLDQKAQELLGLLEDNSPLSTKALKKATDLQGRDLESQYNRSMKSLWNRFLIVGFGEVDDGAFPSLAVGATCLIFDDLWAEAGKMSDKEMDRILKPFFEKQPLFEKFWNRLGAVAPQRKGKKSSASERPGILRGEDIFLK